MLKDTSDAASQVSPSPTTAASTTAFTSSSGAVSLISSAYCDWEGRVEPAGAGRAILSAERSGGAAGHTSTDETTDETDTETETETETEAATTTTEGEITTNDEQETDEDEDDDEDDDDGYERPDLDEPIYMSVGRHLSLEELDAQEPEVVTQNTEVRHDYRHHERRKSVTLRIDDDLDHDGDRTVTATVTATAETTATEKVIHTTPPLATRQAAAATCRRARYGDFNDSSATSVSSGYASPPSAARSPICVPRGRSGRRGGVVAVDDITTAAAAASAVTSPASQRYGGGGEDPLQSSTDDGYVDYSRGSQQPDGTAVNAGAVVDEPDTINLYTELGTDLLRDMGDDELKRRFMHFLSLLPARPERRSLLDKLLLKRSVDNGGDDGVDSDQKRAGSASEYDWPVLVSAGDGCEVVEAQIRSDSSQSTRTRSGSSRRAKRKEKKEKKKEERRVKRKAKKEKRREEREREKGKEKGRERRCSRCEEMLGRVAMEMEKKQSSGETAVTATTATMSEEEKAAARSQREERRERKRKEKEEEERSRKSEDRERRRKREERRERAERKKKREEEKQAIKLKKQKAKAAKAAVSQEKPARTRKKLGAIKRETSGLTKKDLNFDRQWNEEYQSVLDKGIEGMTFDDMSKISKLVHDFVYNAETYAKVIINELNVDDKKKTIKPAGVGGVAGGEKFIVQGILFKFCRDPMISASPPLWLYGGWRPVDEYAMKAAGLELQGLGLIANPLLLPYIRHPLMTLIDYKGFRIVATCVLPLGPHTLCYGSNDGGKTVLARDPVFNKAMEKVGKCLNLKKHTVGRQRVPIIGPGDIEGHLGTDGRYYMLDYARLMPPEEPPLGTEEMGDRSVFFKMLRPEIVQKYHSPLSSDAFTGWSKYDVDIAQSERDIREATKLLVNEAIPALARELDDVDVSDLLQSVTEYEDVDLHKVHLDIVERVNLVYRMHSRGINMRNLGRLRQLVTNPDWKTIILGEATSRCAKQMIKARMRQAVTQSFGVSSESLCKDLILDHLNNIIGASPGKESYMKHHIKPVLLEKFPGLLTDDEMDPALDLRTSLPMKLVFILSKRWELLRVSEHVTRKMLADPYCNVRVLPNDVQEMVACVKKPPMIHIIDASMYIVEAMAPGCNGSEAIRLLETALEHLTTAGNVMPSVPFIMWAIGRVEAEIARRRPFNSETEALLVQAIANHRRALLLEIRDGPTNSLATTLELYAAKLEEAQRQQQQAHTPTQRSGSPLARTSPSSTRRLRRSAAASLTHSAAASPGWTRDKHQHTSPKPLSAEALMDSSSSSASQQRVRLSSSSRSCPSLAATAATALFASSSSFFSSLTGSRGSLAPAVKIARLRAEAAKLRLLARALANSANTSAPSTLTASSDDDFAKSSDRPRMESNVARLLSS